jgi:DNA ligase-associated metallophosphoesterase
MKVRFAGIDCVFDLSGALFWPAEATLVVADLHLEKGSGLAAAGALLPPYDTVAALAALQGLIARHAVRRVVCLGDSFHDVGGAERIAAEDLAVLRRLTGALEWIWVAGNHDPELPAHLGGTMAHDFCLGGLTFRHVAAPDAAPGEVSGHYHPKATVATRGRRVTRPCFVYDAVRLMLPAFGAYTGGLNVRAAAIAGLFPAGFAVALRGAAKLHGFASDNLV